MLLAGAGVFYSRLREESEIATVRNGEARGSIACATTEGRMDMASDVGSRRSDRAVTADNTGSDTSFGSALIAGMRKALEYEQGTLPLRTRTWERRDEEWAL